jgi:hypothetical protein
MNELITTGTPEEWMIDRSENDLATTQSLSQLSFLAVMWRTRNDNSDINGYVMFLVVVTFQSIFPLSRLINFF